MQLPRVSSGPVQSSVAPATRQVAAAVGGLTDTVREGLQAYTEELVRSQTQEATLSLSKRLDEREQEFRTRKAIPYEEAKQRLGKKWDTLDSAVRDQPLVKMRDEKTGEIVERPADIPTWAIAGDLYDLEVESALGESSKHITVGGRWQEKFRGAAAGDVLARKGRLNALQLEAMTQFQQDTRIRQALEFANAGDFPMAYATAAGAGRVLGTEGQAKLRAKIREIELTKPVRDALRMVREPAHTEEGLRQLDRALAALGEPKELDPKELGALTHEAQVAREAAVALKAKRDAAAAAFRYADAAKDERNPLRVNEVAATKALEDDVKAGKLSPEAGNEARRLMQEIIRDRNDGARQELGKAAGDAMEQFLAIGPDGQPRMAFSNVLPETIRQLRTFGQDGEEVIAQLVRWDQSNETHQRQLRQLPSPEQDARTLAVERAIRRSPDTFRRMPTAEVLAILAGKAPVPGEADAPAVAVSSRDLPHLRDMLGGVTAEPAGVQVTSPGAIAQQEFERAFGLERIPSKRWTPEQHAALTRVTDEVAAFVNGERAGGRTVSDEAIREHLTKKGGLLSKLDRKKMLWGLIETGPRTPLHREIEEGGRAPEGELVPNDPTKPIIENRDGTFSTERTMSFRDEDGKETTIATIVGGEQRSDEEAIRLYREGKNPALAKHDTVAEAEAYAQQRHLREERTRAKDRRRPAANLQQVPLAVRARIISDYRAMYGRKPTPADIVRGYNAGLAAGEF